MLNKLSVHLPQVSFIILKVHGVVINTCVGRCIEMLQHINCVNTCIEEVQLNDLLFFILYSQALNQAA